MPYKQKFFRLKMFFCKNSIVFYNLAVTFLSLHAVRLEPLFPEKSFHHQSPWDSKKKQILELGKTSGREGDKLAIWHDEILKTREYHLLIFIQQTVIS